MIRRVLVKQTLGRRILNFQKIPRDTAVVEKQSSDNKDSLSGGFLYGIDIEQIRATGDNSDQIKSLFSEPSKITPRNSHDIKK